jgi:type IV secretory pathway VirJ component
MKHPAWLRLAIALLAIHASLCHAAPPAELRDLPLVEVAPRKVVEAASDGGTLGASFAVLLTGVGGWVSIDRVLSDELAANGLPVVGFNALRYFWRTRTPEETADDVARTIEYYMRAWSRERVVLIGYSLGAEVMPFVVNRLPTDLRSHISATVLIGIGDSASFEFHVRDWVPSAETPGQPIAPELDRLELSKVVCLYGAGESHSLCPRVARAGGHSEQIGSGHHLGGQYREIAHRILAFIEAR